MIELFQGTYIYDRQPMVLSSHENGARAWYTEPESSHEHDTGHGSGDRARPSRTADSPEIIQHRASYPLEPKLTCPSQSSSALHPAAR
jgi:hypothetical protein